MEQVAVKESLESYKKKKKNTRTREKLSNVTLIATPVRGTIGTELEHFRSAFGTEPIGTDALMFRDINLRSRAQDGVGATLSQGQA